MLAFLLSFLLATFVAAPTAATGIAAVILMLLLYAGLLYFIPLLFGAVIRGHVGTLEYATDYTGDASAATWTDIPTLKVMSDGYQNPSEEAQLVQTINGHDASAGKKNVGIFPVAYADDDTFLADLEDAEDNLTPVWFRITPTGESARIIGGDNGTTVYVNRNPMPAWGSLVQALIGFSVTGPTPGDTFRVSETGT